ncbi:DNA/RNA nuclease SfsA [Defluviitalea phaphyphila]|uniref:DNA/RNA nuclease SfsA n=1 Tax=Defluviitalea phaphyphila TaxID=1473580 RepID=UPI0007308092|nr:DNA/RNA nuclease SfsA [Defluviitalea phaphyphila]
MKLNYDIVYGKFIRRPNRFIAHIDVSGKEVICHVPNTGRLKELLYSGVEVILSYHPTSSNRKTKYDLRMIKKGDYWISIDSQLPNALAYEAISQGIIKELRNYSEIKKEITYKNSRFDLQLIGDKTYFIEVKGVTLEKDNWTYFPDAPTSRGRKHIDEIIDAVKNGFRGVILFVVQVSYAKGFSPNAVTDPDFAKKLKEAYKAGVEILAYRCDISTEEVKIVEKIPVVL